MIDQIAMTSQPTEAALECYAQEVQMYVANIRLSYMNGYFNICRVLTEARNICPKGRWHEWLIMNTPFKDREAEQMIQMHTKFGNNPKCYNLQKSTLKAMLSLPDELVGDFLESHDVANMSSRETEKAVADLKKQINEKQQQIEGLEKNLEAANRRADAAENKPPIVKTEIPADVQERLDEKDREIEKLSQNYKDALETQKQAREDLAKAEKEKDQAVNDKEQAEKAMASQNSRYNELKAQLDQAMSKQARGEVENGPVQSDYETLEDAVTAFMGKCAVIPHKTAMFAKMSTAERENYEHQCKVLETWIKSVRNSLSLIELEV